MARRFFGRDYGVHDRDHVVKEVRTERPVIVRERGGGLGFLGTLLTLAVVAVVLWAAGILDLNLYGTDSGPGVGGGADLRITPPDNNNITPNTQ